MMTLLRIQLRPCGSNFRPLLVLARIDTRMVLISLLAKLIDGSSRLRSLMGIELPPLTLLFCSRKLVGNY